MIHAIKQLHDMRMEQLFDAYKRKFKLDEYCTDEKTLKNREKLLKAIAKANK
jgi:alkylhydroperoxidase/carboxymuconolactone decarboxylase family protein YurZ